jgi:hypothetical protein
MNRAIVCICGYLLFTSSAHALTCNEWYETMSGFIAESKQMNGALSAIEKDAAATCAYSRKTKIPVMQRNLKVIRSFYTCQGQTGKAAKQTGASLQRLLKKLANETATKCASVGM